MTETPLSVDKPTSFQAVARKLGRWLLEAAVIVTVLVGFHAWFTRDMLPADQQIAPSLSIPVLQGDPEIFSDTPSRPSLIYFFAPWCNVCAASAHNIRNLRRLRDETDLTIALVALDWQSIEEVSEYVQRHELETTILLGNWQTASEWQIKAFPTYFILDSDRRVVRRDYGYSTLAGLWLRTALVD